MRVHRALTTVLVLVAATTSLHCNSGGGRGGGSPTAPPSTRTIIIAEHSFSPQSLSIMPGDTVRWEFRGNDPTHTTTAMEGTWDSGQIFMNAGDVYERTFTQRDNDQTFEYFCTSHHQCCAMQGSIRVGANAPNPRDGY